MRDHVKEMINEATREPNQDLIHGAILIAKLIATCIENLKNQGFYYIQGEQVETGYLYDEFLGELSIILMKENGETDGKNQNDNKEDNINEPKNEAKVGRKRPRRSRKTYIVIEQQSLDKSQLDAEFVYPFLQTDSELFLSECSLSDNLNRFDDELFDFPFGKDECDTRDALEDDRVDDHVLKKN
jgi:hypothetical protein